MLKRARTWIPIATVILVLAIGWWIANDPWAKSATPDLSQATGDEQAAGTPTTVATRTATATRPASAVRTATATRPASAVRTATATRPASATAGAGDRYDLEADEERGGHTIARHVGKTEQELRDRLAREPDISAASSYFDLEAAERSVALALAAKRSDVTRWSQGSGRSQNLALRCTVGEPVGISVERGARSSREVEAVVVVLRWADGSWYVLTSYPDD